MGNGTSCSAPLSASLSLHRSLFIRQRRKYRGSCLRVQTRSDATTGAAPPLCTSHGHPPSQRPPTCLMSSVRSTRPEMRKTMMMLMVWNRWTFPRTCRGAKGAGRVRGRRQWRHLQQQGGTAGLSPPPPRRLPRALVLTTTDATALPGAGAVKAMRVATRKHSGSQCFRIKARIAPGAAASLSRHAMLLENRRPGLVCAY